MSVNVDNYNPLAQGSTVVVWGLPTLDGRTISGLYVIEEYQPYERSAYVTVPFYVLSPAHVDDQDAITRDSFGNVDLDPLFEAELENSRVEVDADRLREQVDPAGYGREFAREFALALR